MPPAVCKSCKNSAKPDQPLFKCVLCHKHFHSACHRPHPKERSKNNWTCQRCVTRGKDLKATRRYNDSASVSSATSSASLISQQSVKSSSSSRAGSSTMSAAPRSVSSFTPESGGESDRHPPRLIDCSWPGCPAKALPRHPICQAHQQDISFKKLDSASPSAPPPQPQPPRISPDAGRTQSLGAVKPNKLLPENDKDRPILRRKTAGKTAQRDPFMPIQSSSKQSTPSIPGDSFTLSLSPKQAIAIPRPPAHSPPESPSKPRDVEPVRKRQKVSHAPNGVSESRPNGAPTLNSDKGEFDLKHKNEKMHSYASLASSATRPGEKTEKNGFRLSSHTRPTPVRKMAPQNIRPLNGLRGVSPRAENLKQTSSTEFAPPAAAAFVNGFGPSGPNTSNRTHNQTHSLDGNKGPWTQAHDYLTTQINQPANPSHFIQTTAAANRHIEEGSTDRSADGRPTFETNFEPSSAVSSFSREHSEQQIRPSQTNGLPRTHKKKQPRPRETKPAEIIYPTTCKVNRVVPRKMIDETAFDNVIYQQEDASTPPPGVIVSEPAAPAVIPKLEAPDEPVFAKIDPRVHWTLPQSETWFRKKQKEIYERGGRKANFGQAAFRMKQKLLQDGQPPVEETLPNKIRDNPAWTQAVKKLEKEAKEVSQGHTATTKRKPGPKRQLSNGSGPASARGTGNESQATNRSG